MRKDTILEFLEKENINLNSISAVVGRGGLLRPVPSGIFKINEKIVDELRTAKYGEHESNLGALIAYRIAEKLVFKH